jgi:hypothetical protein
VCGLNFIYYTLKSELTSYLSDRLRPEECSTPTARGEYKAERRRLGSNSNARQMFSKENGQVRS